MSDREFSCKSTDISVLSSYRPCSIADMTVVSIANDDLSLPKGMSLKLPHIVALFNMNFIELSDILSTLLHLFCFLHDTYSFVAVPEHVADLRVL